MKDGDYHCEVYWPNDIQVQIDKTLNSGLHLQFSAHAINNKFERKISTSNITIEKLKNGICFEATVKNNKVTKFVIRYGFNDIYDLSSVWMPKSDCLFCKTIWLNKKDDKHETLIKNNYVTYNYENDIQHISIRIGDLINNSKNNK